MRKPAAASVAATKPPLPADSPDEGAVKVVCIALMLALLALAARIASVW